MGNSAYRRRMWPGRLDPGLNVNSKDIIRDWTDEVVWPASLAYLRLSERIRRLIKV
jgi:hypothetical protein